MILKLEVILANKNGENEDFEELNEMAKEKSILGTLMPFSPIFGADTGPDYKLP